MKGKILGVLHMKADLHSTKYTKYMQL